jgi:hypothetical protein
MAKLAMVVRARHHQSQAQASCTPAAVQVLLRMAIMDSLGQEEAVLLLLLVRLTQAVAAVAQAAIPPVVVRVVQASQCFATKATKSV